MWLGQLFIRKSETKEVHLAIAKVTGDHIIAGSVKEMNFFVKEISKHFVISKAVIDEQITFNGCTFLQNILGDIRVCMKRF